MTRADYHHETTDEHDEGREFTSEDFSRLTNDEDRWAAVWRVVARYPAPKRAVDRLRRRVLTGDWESEDTL